MGAGHQIDSPDLREDGGIESHSGFVKKYVCQGLACTSPGNVSHNFPSLTSFLPTMARNNVGNLGVFPRYVIQS
jgi:hypothetical protein